MAKLKSETNEKKPEEVKKAEAPKKPSAPKKAEAPKKPSTPKKAASKKTEFAVGTLVLDHKDREYTILEMPAELSDYSKIVLKDSQGNSLIRLKLKLRLK